MPLTMLLVVVAAAATVGGMAPGFLAASIGLVASAYFVLPPPVSAAWDTRQAIGTSGYAAATIAITLLAHHLRRIRAAADATMARLREEHDLLRRSEDRLALALEVGDIAIWEHDLVRDALTWSDRHYHLLGLDPTTSPATYELWRDTLHPDDRDRMERLYRRAQVDGPLVADYRIVRPDGTVRWLACCGQVMFDDEGRPLRSLGAIVDVTPRVESDEALREADRRKNDFLAMLAHELRNPLGPIRNAAALFEALAPGDARVSQARAMIERQTTHMARLVDDLLDVARITTGAVQLHGRLVELDELVDDAVQQMRPVAEARGVTLAVSTALGPIALAVDAGRIVQALANVIGNACKFTPSGGHVSVTTAQVDDDAVIRVRDDGVGIPADLLPRIFDLFVQGPVALDRSLGGLGIGLTLARRMVELHGGTITASSAGPDHGSEFVLTLPVVPHSSRRAPAPGSAPATKNVDVLIVEDNPDAAESFRMLLELDGHTVRTAGTGREALAAMDERGATVAFVDIGLPEIDGFEVARRLRAHPHGQTMVLVALSGYGTEEDRREGAAAGFDHYFTKPVDVADVRRLLQGLAGESGRILAVVRDISSKTPHR